MYEAWQTPYSTYKYSCLGLRQLSHVCQLSVLNKRAGLSCCKSKRHPIWHEGSVYLFLFQVLNVPPTARIRILRLSRHFLFRHIFS